MNYMGGTTDARLAVLEDNVRKLDTRVNEISSRTHTLVSAGQATTAVLEEARKQRADMIEKLDVVQNTINSLNTASISSVLEMTHHVKMCDQRSARLEKLAWIALGIIITIFGFLAAPYFNQLVEKSH